MYSRSSLLPWNLIGLNEGHHLLSSFIQLLRAEVQNDTMSVGARQNFKSQKQWRMSLTRLWYANQVGPLNLPIFIVIGKDRNTLQSFTCTDKLRVSCLHREANV